jgi:hypothetical protein
MGIKKGQGTMKDELVEPVNKQIFEEDSENTTDNYCSAIDDDSCFV